MGNEFENVLTKMGYRKVGGGATGGRENWNHENGTVVSLSLHPMDRRVLGFEIQKDTQTIASGKEPTELLRSLQDKAGSGAFRKVQYAEPSNKTGGHPLRKQMGMGESLDDYGNNIERAISEMFRLEERAVKEIINQMKFEEYLNLAIALDNENMQVAEEILRNYGIKSTGRPRDIPRGPTPESVTAHINYLSKNREDNIVSPELRQLKEAEQREVLNALLNSQLQKILANLRGYSEPGMFEHALFTNMLKKEIMEAIPNGPNKPNGAASDTRLQKDAAVAVTDDNGETEDGTVVADTGNNVMVQTKTGRKSVTKDKIMQPVVDENAIDIKRFKELAGIKVQPIVQTQTEEIEEEEEINEDDDSLGTNYTLEIDGEDVKKNSDPEELMSYANEHGQGMEWSVYDSDNGDVAATWDETGFLQDAAASSSMRHSKKQGWEAQDEINRGEKLPYELDDYDREEPVDARDIISDQDATLLAQKIAWKIGENWPDGDPFDAAMQVLRQQLGHEKNIRTDSTEWDATAERVKEAFEASEGVNYYGYFNQMTDQMQADNPGTHDSSRFQKGGGGRARGDFDDVPRL